MTKTRAIAYYRVSTDDQEQDGYGLGTQAAAVTGHIKAKKYKQVGEYTDVITGRTDDRSGITQAIADAEAGKYDVLVLLDHSRLGRDIDVSRQIRKDLRKVGVQMEYTRAGDYDPDSRMGKVMDFLGDWQAEGELETMVERSRPARKLAVEAGGLQLTRRPYGYTIKFSDADAPQSITPDPDEARHVVAMFEWAAEGLFGTEIARQLNKMGSRTTTGREWIGKTVLKHLHREIYKGEYEYGKTEIVDSMGNPNLGKEMDAKPAPVPEKEWARTEVPALVSKELWDKANAKLTARSRKHQPHIHNEFPFILRNRIFCGECGNRWHTDIQKDRPSKPQKNTYLNYKHPTGEKANGCPVRQTFKRDDLEARIKQWFVEWVDTPATNWAILIGEAAEENTFMTKSIAKAQRKINGKEQERARAIRMHTKGQISEVETDIELERIEQEKADLENDVASIESQLVNHIYFETREYLPSEGDETKFISTERLDKIIAKSRFKEYTPEEWQAAFLQHGIEIETTANGEVWGSFEADPESYKIESSLPT